MAETSAEIMNSLIKAQVDSAIASLGKEAIEAPDFHTKRIQYGRENVITIREDGDFVDSSIEMKRPAEGPALPVPKKAPAEVILNFNRNGG